LTCGHCGDRLKIEKPVEGIRYCECQTAPASVYGQRTEDIPWTPFIERKDILVWRKARIFAWDARLPIKIPNPTK
jgi:hypothetical protein